MLMWTCCQCCFCGYRAANVTAAGTVIVVIATMTYVVFIAVTVVVAVTVIVALWNGAAIYDNLLLLIKVGEVIKSQSKSLQCVIH